MSVYLHPKFQDSRIILTSFRRGGGGGGGGYFYSPPPSKNEPLKSSTRLGLNEYLSEKTQETKNHKVARKTISTDKRKSMFLENFKTVDGSVVIEVGIMDTFKGSVEPVRGPKLPVKIGKDMTTDKVSVLPKKTLRLRSVLEVGGVGKLRTSLS